MRRVDRSWILVCAAWVLVAADARGLAGEPGASSVPLPALSLSLGEARARTEGDRLSVGTGQIERVWRLTDKGLVTVGLRNVASGKEWAGQKLAYSCDWRIKGFVDDRTTARLVSLTAKPVRRSPWTSDHIEVVAAFDYPDTRLKVEYVVWAYPGLPGLRTQLRLQGMVAYAGKPWEEPTEPPPKPLFRSDVLRGMDEPKRVDVSVAGAKVLRLIVGDAADGTSEDHADWADAKLVDAAGKEVYLSELKPLSFTHGSARKEYGVDKSVAGQPLRIGSKAFDRGIGTHALGEMVFTLDGKYEKFQAWVGVDAETEKAGSVEFVVDTPSPRQAMGMEPSRADQAPVDFAKARRRAAGYFNCTQQRVNRDQPILREETFDAPPKGVEELAWPSLVSVEDGAESLCLVQESHKCVNQPGVDTGVFRFGPQGLAISGLGPSPRDILRTRERECWATWWIVSSGGDDGRELAIHTFDRARFPVDPQRDACIMANPWGSGNGAKAANEANLLREIESAADLGIDVQKIDPGWGDRQAWQPDRTLFPQGWTKVAAAAKRHGVRLGLWLDPSATEKDVLRNSEQLGGVPYYMYDGFGLGDYARIEELTLRTRAILEHTRYKGRMDWDVTEADPRVGYFFAREYGRLFLTNRFTSRMPIYIPFLILRDAWHLAKYVNLGQVQITIQNVDELPKREDQRNPYTHTYAVGIALMGSPLFFQETHLYSEEARKQIRPLLALYKKHRAEIFSGCVFPIGNEPADNTWTGFQCHLPAKNAGYLAIFREAFNGEAEGTLRLKFLAGKKIQLTDLRHDTQRTVELAADAQVAFSSPKVPNFGFYRYEVVP